MVQYIYCQPWRREYLLKMTFKRTTTAAVITRSAAMVALLLATTALGYYTSARTKLNQNVSAHFSVAGSK